MIHLLCVIKLQSHITKKQKQALMKKEDCKTQNFYILLAFSLITVALLIDVSIYCYLIKYRGKQNHCLLFHF